MSKHRIPRTVVVVGCHLCGEYAKPLRKCSEGYICAACAQRQKEAVPKSDTGKGDQNGTDGCSQR